MKLGLLRLGRGRGLREEEKKMTWTGDTASNTASPKREISRGHVTQRRAQ